MPKFFIQENFFLSTWVESPQVFLQILPLKSTSPLRSESRTSTTLWTRGLSLSSGTERNSFTLIAPDLSKSNLWKRFSSLKYGRSTQISRYIPNR